MRTVWLNSPKYGTASRRQTRSTESTFKDWQTHTRLFFKRDSLYFFFNTEHINKHTYACASTRCKKKAVTCFAYCRFRSCLLGNGAKTLVVALSIRLIMSFVKAPVPTVLSEWTHLVDIGEAVFIRTVQLAVFIYLFLFVPVIISWFRLFPGCLYTTG